MDFTLVCSPCQVIADDTTSGGVVCPKCGKTGSATTVQQAKQALEGQVTHAVAKELQDTLKKATRGSKHLTYNPGRLPSNPSTFGAGFVFVPKSEARRYKKRL